LWKRDIFSYFRVENVQKLNDEGEDLMGFNSTARQHAFLSFRKLPRGWFPWGALIIACFPLFAQTISDAPESLHRPYDILLQLYVSGARFDYDRMWRNEDDLQRLADYVDTLQTRDPSEWPREAALAYWINLYNAATLNLVLQNYPVKSIKDIGGFMKSPWSRKVARVAGKELTLDDIEHKIIRPRFKDARIHFALNCAAIGCPPLSNRAFAAETLEQQLEAACYAALNDPRWVEVTGREIRVSKIFDWYRKDFEEYSGSLREFIARYREKDRETILDETRKLTFKDYDWSLNKVEL